VSRYDDVVGGEIKTLVTFVVSEVSEKNTSDGPECQFMSGFSGEIRIACTTEHAQVLIWGGDSMQGEVWTGRADRLGGETVQQICGGVEPLYPIASRNRSLKKQGTQHIIDGAKDSLGFTVLRSVGTRHPQKYPFGGEECTRGGVIKLTTIVALNDFDGAAKLCGDISKFFWQSGKSARFNVERKSPHKMEVIIKDNRIVFVARYANNRRSP
jgi:hypothetical protein